MLVDTDVLIWFFRGWASAARILKESEPIQISAITHMELAQGARNRAELQQFRKAINQNGWRIRPVSESISDRAIVYIENFALSHGVEFADALIGATSIELGLTLLTANDRHFACLPGISLKVYRPGLNESNRTP